MSDSTLEDIALGTEILSNANPLGRTSWYVLPDALASSPDRTVFLYGYDQPDDAPEYIGPFVGITDGTIEGTHTISTSHLLPKETLFLGESIIIAGLSRDHSGMWLGDKNTDELWISDGSPNSMQMVDLWEKGQSAPRELTQVGDSVYFTAESDLGRELWMTDGSAEGTRLFTDLRPGSQSSNPSDLLEFENGLAFIADDGIHGRTTWFARADGELHQANLAGAIVDTIFRDGEDLYIAANSADSGELEFWLWNPISSSLSQIGNIQTATTAQENAIDVVFEKIGDTIYVMVDNGQRLYSIGTSEIQALSESPTRQELMADWNGLAVFSGPDRELWTSDGTPDGTRKIASVDVRAASVVGDTVVFTGTVENRTTIWTYNGEEINQLLRLPVRTGSIYVHGVVTWEGHAVMAVADAANNVPRSCDSCFIDAYSTYLITTDGQSFELIGDDTFEFLAGFDTVFYSKPKFREFHETLYLSSAGTWWSIDVTSETVTATPVERESELYHRLGDSTVVWNRPLPHNAPGQPLSPGLNRFAIGNVGDIVYSYEFQGFIATQNHQQFEFSGQAERASQTLAATDDAIYFASDLGGQGVKLFKATGGQTIEEVELTAELFNTLFSESPNLNGGVLYFPMMFEIWSLDDRGFRQLPSPEEMITLLTVVGDHALYLKNTEEFGTEIWTMDLAPSIPGDADGSGTVDFSDFLILSANFGHNVDNGAADGDFDDDGQVSFADFLILSANFQN